jgi:hypothetical protein
VSENNIVRKINGADQIYDRGGKEIKPMVQTKKFIKKLNKFPGSRNPEFQTPQNQIRPMYHILSR